ncbi:hypothetical protein FRC17_008840 [Serendipita sp. 399]|nr:hypothetical protein FRC17_008840 [Serendipita sp. 399]
MADIFPDEILAQIFEEINSTASRNQSFFSLFATSRRFYRIAVHVFYKAIQLTGSEEITRFLGAILANPHPRKLVKELSIWITDIKYSDLDLCDELPLNSTELHSTLHTLFPRTPWANMILEALRKGSIPACALLTIALLSDLQILDLEAPLGDKFIDGGLLMLGIEKTLPPKLRTLQRSAGFKYEYPLLYEFLCVPSLRQISLCGVESSRNGGSTAVPVRRRDGVSNVDVLHLLSARINGQDLANLLRLSRSLRELVYLDRTMGKRSPRVQFGPFDDALKSVANTLESLSLIWYDTNEDDLHQGLLSLRKFRRLQKLTIQFELLLGQVPGQLTLTEALPTSIKYIELRKSDAWWHRSGDCRANPWTDPLCVDAVRGLLDTEDGQKFTNLQSIYLCIRGDINSLIPMAQKRSIRVEKEATLVY